MDSIKQMGNRFAFLYHGSRLHSGRLSEGNPVALNDLEEDGSKWAEETIAKIEAIIGDPRTPWKECNESDTEYIDDTLAMWGMGD